MQWYAVFVVTGKERIAAEEIEKKLICSQNHIQYQLMLFQLVVFERFSEGKTVKREKIMFPGYLFVGTDDIEKLYRLVLGSKNIIKFLRTDNYFTPVSEQEMNRLLSISDEHNLIGPSEIFIENESVRVFKGPLINYTGKVYKIDRRKKRVKVAFEVNGNTTFMNLSVTILEKVNSEESKNTIDFAKHKTI